MIFAGSLSPESQKFLNANSRLTKLLKVWRPPFKLDNEQSHILNGFGADWSHGYWWKPGRGKTIATSMHALNLMEDGEAEHCIVLIPPIITLNWFRSLSAIQHAEPGRHPTVTMYRGTPKRRKDLDLNAQFILMSYELFKRDFDRLDDFFKNRKVMGIADEAHKIKNIETDAHKACRFMFGERPFLMASGTPVSSPKDVFAYTRFNNRQAYRNLRHFEELHVKEYDDREQPLIWQNLDILNKNLLTNATYLEKPQRVEGQDNWRPIPLVYELDDKHLALYHRICDEQLVELENGNQINAVGAQRLFQTVQQVILNWAHFAGEEGLRPAGLDLCEEVLDEIQGEKLMVVANYRLSVRMLVQALAPYGAVGINGDMTYNQQMASVRRFMDDPKCRVVVLNPEAGGVGLDGLQEVCSEALFIECPTLPRQFWQALARLDRTGQKAMVNCRIAIANRTIQVSRHKKLLANDDLVTTVEGGSQSLREAIYGQ